MGRRRAELRHPDRQAGKDTTVGYCHPGTLDAAFSHCLLNLVNRDWLHEQRIRKFVYIESGPRIAAARNRVIAAWLMDPQSQWLWMLDTDMTFEPDTLDRLLSHADKVAAPIVGGLCFAGGRDFRIAPTIYVAKPDAAPGELQLQIHLDYPEDTLCRVHGTGAACLLIHRTVAERLYERNRFRTVYPWFAETEIPPTPEHDGKDIGEDITFCLRAGQEGFPIHVHTGIKIGHRKTMTLDETEFLANRAHIDDVGEDEARREGLAKIGVTPDEAPRVHVA